LLDLKIDNNKF
jgi:hypothetical protein